MKSTTTTTLKRTSSNTRPVSRAEGRGKTAGDKQKGKGAKRGRKGEPDGRKKEGRGERYIF